MKNWLFLPFILLMIGSAAAQDCGTTSYIDHLETLYPGIKKSMDQSYLSAVRMSEVQSLGKFVPTDTIFTVPIVFHVVYQKADQNISDELILNQLAVLNAAFNRENADTVNTRDIFKPVAGSSRIRFVMASVDPEGNPTDGIERRQTTLASFNASGNATTTDYVKQATYGLAAWDAQKYLNIWICNLNLADGTRSLFGYAYPPVNANFWASNYYKTDPYQGVVLHYETIGRGNPSNLDSAYYTNEKTMIHEVGHYFGLRHIWGDSPITSYGCSYDDYIDDTPNAKTKSSGCNYSANTCNADAMPDMVENYMDYSSAKCTNMFTKQQVAVMRYNLINLRTTLPQSQEIIGTEIPDVEIEGVFPNPFFESVSVTRKAPTDETIHFTMTDMLGREIFYAEQTSSEYVVTFNGIDLPAGIYWVNVQVGESGTVYRQKMIKGF
ncbi:MAG: T9SS type A sorting domain-containing protein [Bacteroidetes bacterium]|nr:T9SS type A sorting domain-containing protein [Bacteroidota bacterium]